MFYSWHRIVNVQYLNGNSNLSLTLKNLKSIRMCSGLAKKTIETDSNVEFDVTKWLHECKECEYYLPWRFTPKQLSPIKNLQTNKERLGHLVYLYKRAIKEIEEQQRKALLLEKNRHKKKERLDNEHINYALFFNNMFIRCKNLSMKAMYELRVANLLRFSPSIIIDCSISNCMSQRESHISAAEMVAVITNNTRSNFPFNINITSVDDKANYWYKMNTENNFLRRNFVNITSQHYLDLFPKEKLIYLSPDAHEEVEYFDGDTIYIIGNLVDFDEQKNVSYCQARMDGIKCQKLPLKISRKRRIILKISHVVELLNDMQWKDEISVSVPKLSWKKFIKQI